MKLYRNSLRIRHHKLEEGKVLCGHSLTQTYMYTLICTHIPTVYACNCALKKIHKIILMALLLFVGPTKVHLLVIFDKSLLHLQTSIYSSLGTVKTSIPPTLHTNTKVCTHMSIVIFNTHLGWSQWNRMLLPTDKSRVM